VAGRSGQCGAVLVRRVALVIGQGIVRALIQHRNMEAPTAPDRRKKPRTAIYCHVQVNDSGITSKHQTWLQGGQSHFCPSNIPL